MPAFNVNTLTASKAMKEWVIRQFEAVETNSLSKEQFTAFVQLITADPSHPFVTECFEDFEERKEFKSL